MCLNSILDAQTNPAKAVSESESDSDGEFNQWFDGNKLDSSGMHEQCSLICQNRRNCKINAQQEKQQVKLKFRGIVV